MRKKTHGTIKVVTLHVLEAGSTHGQQLYHIERIQHNHPSHDNYFFVIERLPLVFTLFLKAR
jgi:hypothetical protein